MSKLLKKKKDRISKLPSFKINPQFLLQNAVEFWWSGTTWVWFCLFLCVCDIKNCNSTKSLRGWWKGTFNPTLMLYQSGGISYSHWEEVTQTGTNNPSKFGLIFPVTRTMFYIVLHIYIWIYIEFLWERKNPNPDSHITCNFLSQDRQHEINGIQNWMDNSVLQEVIWLSGMNKVTSPSAQTAYAVRILFVENTWPHGPSPLPFVPTSNNFSFLSLKTPNVFSL